MISVLKTKILFLSLTLFISVLKTVAQDFIDQGEGKVVVDEFLSLDQSPDLSKPYQTCTFYVKNFKVLREEPKFQNKKSQLI